MLQRLGITTRWLRILTATALASFLLASFLTIDMGMDHQMGMGCAIASKGASQSGCMMDPGAHLTWWSSTFTGIPGGSSLAGLITLMGALLVVGLLAIFSAPLSSLHVRLARRGKAPPEEGLRDYFTLFLAAGKAQPLLYA